MNPLPKPLSETPALSDWQRERYSRQIMQPELGEEGQRRLAAATVLISRHGGLGGPIAQSLCLAGVGKFILVHPGKLVSPGLNRMVLMSEQGLGKAHAKQSAEFLKRYRRDLEVEAHDCSVLDLDNLDQIVSRCDAVVSAAPTFEERRALNAACLKTATPMVEAAMTGFNAILFTVLPGQSACLDCAFPDDAGWSEPFPVIGAVSHALGAMAALEVINILTNKPKLAGQMLLWDARNMEMRKIRVARNPACATCGDLE